MTAIKFAVALGIVLWPGFAAATDDAYAFIHVNLVPMDRERVLIDHYLLVRGGQIVELGPQNAFRQSNGLIVIDAADGYLLPGLAEMHAHVPGGDRIDYVHEVLFLYVANGVTLARGMLGRPYHLDLRDQLARHEVLGPRLYTSGPSLNGNSVDGPADAERQVREQARAGYDFLKLHPGLARAEFDAIARTARELGLPFAGHVSSAVGLERVLEVGQASIDHLDGYLPALVDPREAGQGDGGFFGLGLAGPVEHSRIEAVAAATADAGVWNVPTQSLIEQLALPGDPNALTARPAMRYVAPETVQRWIADKRELQADPDYDPATARRFVDIRRRLILALHRAGAGLLLGSDAPQVFNVPGFSIHEELALLVAAGLTPYEALRTGTVHPAQFFGAEDRFGTIAVGREADLLLVDGDPLQDLATLRRPRGVMVRGHWLDRAELDERLTEIAARYAQQ